MQPLDVAVFDPFKTCYAAAIYSRPLQEPGIPLTTYDIGALVDNAFKRSMTPSNTTFGFQRTGIFSFDDNIFDDSGFAPSVVTDRPCPEPMKPVMNPEPGSSQENGSLSSNTSGHCFQSPEETRGYSKALPRKESRRDRKRGRSMIANNTPEKEALAQCRPKAVFSVGKIKIYPRFYPNVSFETKKSPMINYQNSRSMHFILIPSCSHSQYKLICKLVYIY